MHTLWFRVKVLNCFYSWLCRYSVEIFVSKSISLNIEIFIRHACTFSHWTDIDGHLSQKKQKYQAVAKTWNRREWINKNGKHLRHLPLGVGPRTPLMILNIFFIKKWKIEESLMTGNTPSPYGQIFEVFSIFKPFPKDTWLQKWKIQADAMWGLDVTSLGLLAIIATILPLLDTKAQPLVSRSPRKKIKDNLNI